MNTRMAIILVLVLVTLACTGRSTPRFQTLPTPTTPQTSSAILTNLTSLVSSIHQIGDLTCLSCGNLDKASRIYSLAKDLSCRLIIRDCSSLETVLTN
jgi:hypothetical protein